MIIGAKTIGNVAQDLTNWLFAKEKEIDEAYQDAGNELNISASIKFYTDKFGKHRYKVKAKFATGHEIFDKGGDINEAQHQLPGMD